MFFGRSNGGDALAFKFSEDEFPSAGNVPFVRADGKIVSDTANPLKSDRSDDATLTAATDDWPADDARVRKLAERITANATTENDQVRQLLEWFTNQRNIRYGGPVGSRHGVRKVLSQKHGRCWDYSGVFISLCRAKGIPCRQVQGWIHNGDGHVWADVLVNGSWQQVDPTTGTNCGSDYIPVVVSEDGQMPVLYKSFRSHVIN